MIHLVLEVWADLNGDGRYEPDYKKGERIKLTATDSSYKEGVFYSVDGIKPLPENQTKINYIFRVGDKYWNPAEAGGVIPENNSGISYNSWQIKMKF